MEKTIARFRRLAEAHFGGRPSPGYRYPEALRALAVEVASGQLADGWSLAAVAEALGVGIGTLRRWLDGAPSSSSSLRAVEVVGDETGPWEDSRDCGLVLVTAAGHRIEGLALAEVALLLESLG
ncbi:MAG: helix-turn-helix domain-containing protein [Acidobacteria bacterium]|nr:helix-turn-helix domain-containing protein [Acidobacteriota bacterium]MCB1057954.1 helix-turn-helix domain-containing protein [Acidobacteriota bacterium]